MPSSRPIMMRLLVPDSPSSTEAYCPVSPISCRTWCASRCTSYPQTRARPPSDRSSVARIRTAVVLPAPFGPSSPSTCPCHPLPAPRPPACGRLATMTGLDQNADFHRYLQDAREAMVWKLNGLSEYDIRRPLVPTGTNLLGLIKHVTLVEFGYFCDTFGRPHEPLPEFDPANPNADMW